jgi:hypothetical protein
MHKIGMVPAIAACLTASLACKGVAFLPPLQVSPSPSDSMAAAAPGVTRTPTLTAFPTSTASPTPIPGIQNPVAVGEAQLLIRKALRRDVYRCGGEILPADDPESEEFLLLVLKVVKGPSMTISGTKIWIVENGIDGILLGYRIPDGREGKLNPRETCFERNPDTYVLTQIMLAYLIPFGAEDFLAFLPDGTVVPLGSLMP